jgi:hypothetical protein
LYELGGENVNYVMLKESASNPFPISGELIFQVKGKVEIKQKDHRYHTYEFFSGWNLDAPSVLLYDTSDADYPDLPFPQSIPFAGTVPGGYMFQAGSRPKQVHIKKCFIQQYQ